MFRRSREILQGLGAKGKKRGGGKRYIANSKCKGENIRNCMTRILKKGVSREKRHGHIEIYKATGSIWGEKRKGETTFAHWFRHPSVTSEEREGGGEGDRGKNNCKPFIAPHFRRKRKERSSIAHRQKKGCAFSPRSITARGDGERGKGKERQIVLRPVRGREKRGRRRKVPHRRPRRKIGRRFHPTSRGGEGERNRNCQLRT